jgi:hypothetical protein
VYQQLDEKITDHGGVQNIFGINRKSRQALESITISDLDNMLNQIYRAKEGPTRLQEDVVEIGVLKEVLNSGSARAGERQRATGAASRNVEKLFAGRSIRSEARRTFLEIVPVKRGR